MRNHTLDWLNWRGLLSPTLLAVLIAVSVAIPLSAHAILLHSGEAPGNIAVGFNGITPSEDVDSIDLQEVEMFAVFEGQTVSEVRGPGGSPGDGGPFRRLDGAPTTPFSPFVQAGNNENLQILDTSGEDYAAETKRLIIGLVGEAFLGTGSIAFLLAEPTDMFGAYVSGYNNPFDDDSNDVTGEAFFDFYDASGNWLATLTGTTAPNGTGCRRSFEDAQQRYNEPNPDACGANNTSGSIWFETEVGEESIAAVVFSHNDFDGLGLGGIRVTRNAPIVPTAALLAFGFLLLAPLRIREGRRKPAF